MAKDSRAEFVKKYRPIAEQVGKEIGVDPNVILSQWALESGWGSAVPAENNIAGIKDFTGAGTPAKDNKLGTTSNYARFESPEVFGVYYSDMMQRQFPKALNTGSDIGAFTRGLRSGRSGSYFEADPTKYAVGLTAIHNSLPGTEPAPRPTVEEPKEQEPPEQVDDQMDARMQADEEAFERRQAQIYGGVAGAALSGKQAIGDIIESGAARVGRGFQTGRASVPTGGLPATPAPAASPAGGLSVEPTSAQTTRILQGTTGDAGTTGRARMSGFNTETSQVSQAQKEAYARAQALKNMGVVAEDAPAFFSKQPGMTSSPSGVLIPRSEPAQTLGPRGPSGERGYTRPPQIPSQLTTGGAPALDLYRPPPAKAVSGLESVSQLFKRMIDKTGPVASTVGKYVAPPLALASAAGEGMNIVQQAGKPKDQRDLMSMGLSGLNIIGSGMSMFPVTMPIGIPLSLGTAAAQAYRQNPEFKKFVDENVMQRSESPDGGLPYAAP